MSCLKNGNQWSDTYLLLLLVEIVNDDTDKKVECEKGAKDDEDDKVYVHVEVDLIGGLFFNLREIKHKIRSDFLIYRKLVVHCVLYVESGSLLENNLVESDSHRLEL